MCDARKLNVVNRDSRRNKELSGHMEFAVSVIIPSYKPQDYLWECLESVHCQTLGKAQYEVLIILNGPKEPYWTMVEEYIERSMSGTNVRLFYSEPAGVSRARNLGLDMATGKYVAFVDDDDYVSPRYLECLLSKSAEGDAIAVCYPFAFVDGKPEQIKSYSKTTAYMDLFGMGGVKCTNAKARKFFSIVCMKLIDTSFIQTTRFDPELKNGEDSLFMFEISNSVSHCVLAERDAVYYRRIRNNSAYFTKKKFGEKYRITRYLVKAYTRLYFNGLKTNKPYNSYFYFTRIIAAIRQMLPG